MSARPHRPFFMSLREYEISKSRMHEGWRLYVHTRQHAKGRYMPLTNNFKTKEACRAYVEQFGVYVIVN